MTPNILIVDDEPSALKLLDNLLTTENYRVRPFNSGELALRSAAAEIPELVLLDIRMPGMDGFEVCKRLKSNPLLSEVPVIFISAADDLEDKLSAFQAGGVDYITKPFQREEVIARVKTHIALNRSRLEIKRIAEALCKSETRLKMAQTIARLGHWEWDRQAGQFDWSEEIYRIFGFTPQQLPAGYESFLQVVHPDDRAQVAASLNHIQDGTGFDIEYRIVLPNGRIRVVYSKAQVVNLDNLVKPKIVGTLQCLPERDQVTMLGIIQDITERKQLEQQLKQQANTDYLTGCASRRYFLEYAQHEILRIRRYGGELSLLMLDLDHFKDINDRYGHHMGDVVLKKLVEVCRGLLREVDLLGRLGGEEFAILLPKTHSIWALEIARRLCLAVATTEVPQLDPTPLKFTTSIGVAGLLPSDAQIETLLDRADRALYQAKHEGRNRACEYEK